MSLFRLCGVGAIVIRQSDLLKNFYKLWKRPVPMRGTFPAQEPMLQHARSLYRAEEAKDLQSLVASKIEDTRHFDVAGIERAVAICYLGNSGSHLLASYLDGHDDICLCAINLLFIRSSKKSFLQCAGRPATSSWCKSYVMTEWKLVAREPGDPTSDQSRQGVLVGIGKARSRSR